MSKVNPCPPCACGPDECYRQAQELAEPYRKSMQGIADAAVANRNQFQRERDEARAELTKLRIEHDELIVTNMVNYAELQKARAQVAELKQELVGVKANRDIYRKKAEKLKTSLDALFDAVYLAGHQEDED